MGVGISITTILAAAYLGVAAGLGEARMALGALAVLGVNVAMLMTAGTVTLGVQRRFATGRTDFHLWRAKWTPTHRDRLAAMTVEHAVGEPVDGSEPGGHPRTTRVMAMVAERNTSHLDLPVLGRVQLPPSDQLAFMGGILVLAAVGIMEWPVAVVITTGHLLAHNRHVQALRDFGEALEEA